MYIKLEKKFDIKPVDTNEVNEALFVDIKDIKSLKKLIENSMLQ